MQGGVGFAYEYGGAVLDAMSMDERMTICNMSIEGGARVGYVNPDATTEAYIEGREFAPAGDEFQCAAKWWRSLASGPGANYDDVVTMDGADIAPMVTWGINPGQVTGVDDVVPSLEGLDGPSRAASEEALEHMSLEPGRSIAGIPIDVAFVGSCTNARLRLARSRASGPGRARARPRQGAGRAGLAAGENRGRGRGPGRRLPRRRLRVARRRLLHVPGHEPGQAGQRPGLRLIQQPQLQGPSGQPAGPHAADEPRHGGRRRGRG